MTAPLDSLEDTGRAPAAPTRLPGVRVGTDLVCVEGVAASVRDFGDRYLDRIYTPAEIAYCQGGQGSQGGPATPEETARRLAARFAAKEACVKVLRPTTRWLDWRQIEVVKMPGGWCALALHGDALALSEAGGLQGFSVSLSHEHSHAMAVVAATVAPVPAH